MRLREHLRNANVPGLAVGGELGLGGGLGETDRTAVVHRLNYVSRCTDHGYVKRFNVTSEIFVSLRKSYFF